MALRPPAEVMLTASLRRVARERPDLFERLGAFRDAAFVVAPNDFPVGFRLRPSGTTGTVRVVRPDDPAPCVARISGPLLTLLALFDGSGDADAAFFARQIRVEGDTGAVVALHNTLEAADLAVADLLGLRPPLRDAANRGFAALASRLRGG